MNDLFTFDCEQNTDGFFAEMLQGVSDISNHTNTCMLNIAIDTKALSQRFGCDYINYDYADSLPEEMQKTASLLRIPKFAESINDNAITSLIPSSFFAGRKLASIHVKTISNLKDNLQTNLWEALKELDNNENRFKALAFLYKQIESDLNNSNFEGCNKKILAFLDHKFSIRLHIGLLTITNRDKQHLKNRELLYEKTEELCQEKYTDPKVTNSVLFGLK